MSVSNHVIADERGEQTLEWVALAGATIVFGYVVERIILTMFFIYHYRILGVLQHPLF